MLYLANAFSLQMLDTTKATTVSIKPISIDDIKTAGFVSVVGHPDTAAVLTDMLGKKVKCNRASITLKPTDTLIVAQIVGGRLPAGTTKLPDGFKLQFLKVTIL